VSFQIRRGERIGIVGRNGAGKSTLLKILSRVAYPTEGEARVRGRLTALLEVGAGFSERMTGRENIFLNAGLYGLSPEEVRERLDAIIDFAELRRFIDTPIKFYSSGMRARLGFAVAAHLEPDILLLDEVLAVGDLAFQRKCLERMEDMTGQGRTLLFVSHSMESVSRFCDRCIWLDNGRMCADGSVEAVTSAYVEAHLKTRAHVDHRADVRRQTLVTSSAPQIASNTVADASLLSASIIINEERRRTNVMQTGDQIGVTFDFLARARGVYVPAIMLHDAEGRIVFASVPSETRVESFVRDTGEHRATVWLPRHFLNNGAFSVTISVVSPEFAPLKRYIQAERLLSFVVVEGKLSDSAPRGAMPREFPGAIRPMLNWTLEAVEDEDVEIATAGTL
jgi:lipopolysaccharide transport system ATP-binding protein